jgi:hypothetical protein
MKASLTNLTVFAVVATLAAAASAQTHVVPAYGYGGGYYDDGYGYHASTLEEGVLRGYSSLAQGIGQRNYLNSLAAINFQEARSRSIQNRQRAIEGYFYNKQANNSARAAMRSPRLTEEQYVALAKVEAPARLTEQQYDRTFGRLNWPAALAGDEFAAERRELDRVFASRSPGDAGASTDFYAAVKSLSRSLEAKLKTQVENFDAAQYMTAKKFLASLPQEALNPMVVRALAAR